MGINHPYEGLAKSGYKPDMKYTWLINLLATHWKPTLEIWENFNPFFPRFWQIENPLGSLHFSIFDLNFSFWQKNPVEKKAINSEDSSLSFIFALNWWLFPWNGK